MDEEKQKSDDEEWNWKLKKRKTFADRIGKKLILKDLQNLQSSNSGWIHLIIFLSLVSFYGFTYLISFHVYTCYS